MIKVTYEYSTVFHQSSPSSARLLPQRKPTNQFISRNSTTRSTGYYCLPRATQLNNTESTPILFYQQNSCQESQNNTRRFSDQSVPSNYYSDHKPLQQTFYQQPRNGGVCPMANTMQNAMNQGCVLYGGTFAGRVLKNSSD